MKAARKARQNTLGTARRKAHTPRHTQRRITAENTRRRLATASLHAAQYLRYTRQAPTHRRKRTPRHSSIRCPCYTRAQRQHIAENARRDTPSAAVPRKAYTPCPSKKAAPPTYTSLHAAQYLRYTRPVPPHRRESAHAADIRQFDALATRAPHFQRPRASRRTRFRSARHPFSSCADVTFIL